MSVAGINPINNQTMMPYYNNYAAAKKTDTANGQGAVAISTPQGKQIYNYPQTSIYNEPAKSASGVNIYVFNPSGIGAPSTFNNNFAQTPNSPIANTPIANTSLKAEKSETEKPKKTKNIVKLTDDYIMTEESFLRSEDAAVRKQGIIDLVKRFEEDESRYDNPSLTALLNIALQDSDVHNRMLALGIIASGGAHGDENTIQLLDILKNSEEMYGQEAKMAANALLKTSQTREKVPDENNYQATEENNNNNEDNAENIQNEQNEQNAIG